MKTHRRASFALLSFLMTAPLAGAPAQAQDKTGEIDTIFSWATPTTPGCACAVSLNGKVVVNRAYGSADLERGVAITPETRFDVGSVVKQFVAASTLMLVEEGRLSLTEDVHSYIPELPDYGATITLDHLLTHTSGIRDWTGLGPLTGRNVDALTLTLRQRALNFPPGEEFSYSNSGYVLLQEIVARTSGMTFSEFAQKRIFDPLGMKSTTYRHDLRDVVPNRALAYEKEDHGWRMDILLDNARGGQGGLLSTTGDLLIWNDALASGRLGAFVTQKLQEPTRLNNGRRLEYARGLFVVDNPGGKLVWHGGGSGAYNSVVGRYPERGFSIAILCNAGESAGSTTAAAAKIFDLLVPGAAQARAEARAKDASVAVPVEGIDLQNKTGLFFSEATGEPLRLGADKGALRIQGGPPLVAVAPDRFRNQEGMLQFRSQDKFELHFLSSDALEIKSMEGKTTRYRRARPDAPTAADLKGFAGRYGNDETRSVLEMEPGHGALMVRVNVNDAQTFEFKPVDRDAFQRGGMVVRFRRDKAGNVVGLDYSNPVVRRVQFTRLSDDISRR